MTSHSPRATQAIEAAAETEPRPPTTTRNTKSSWPWLLSGAFVLAGIALATLPAFLPQHAWIAKGLAKHGLSSGPFVVSGCVLFGVAWMLRSQIQSAAQEPSKSDRDLIFDQLASELAQMRGGIQELRVEFVYLKDAQQSLLQAHGDRNAAEQGEAQHAAIFRLAASLDQVGARLEQRLTAQHAVVQSSLDQLNQGLQATWLQLASTQAQVDHGTSGPNGSQATSDYDLEIPLAPSHERERAGHDSSSNDDLEVWVELEEPTTSRSLGLLDTLDDPNSTQPAKTSASLRPSIGREGSRSAASRRASPPEAPLPRTAPSTDGYERDIAGHDGAPIEGKLALLKSLLADARVRQALESMRRSER